MRNKFWQLALGAAVTISLLQTDVATAQQNGNPRQAEYLSRVADISNVEAEDFPQSHPPKGVVTPYEAPGLRFYYRQSDLSGKHDNWMCVPKTIYADIYSAYLLNHIGDALAANSQALAKAAVSSALAHCYGFDGKRWPALSDREIRLYHFGDYLGSIAYSAAVPAVPEFEVNVELGILKQAVVKPDFKLEQQLLDRFWKEWISGVQSDQELEADLRANSRRNSHLAVAYAYRKLGLKIGEPLNGGGTIDALDVLDAAILGHPQSALIVADSISRALRPSRLIRSKRELSDEQVSLLALMNNLYAKAWVVQYPPARVNVQQVSSLNLGLREMVALVEKDGMRTTPDHLRKIDLQTGEPSATALLSGIQTYHDQDCSRYEPYARQLNTVERSLETSLGEFSWTTRPVPTRSGAGCVLQFDFGSMPMTINDVQIRSCTARSSDIYVCSIDIGFECPIRGAYQGVPGLSAIVTRTCAALAKNWRGQLSISAQRRGYSWDVFASGDLPTVNSRRNNSVGALQYPQNSISEAPVETPSKSGAAREKDAPREGEGMEAVAPTIPFEVAGVGLGMSLSEAEAAAKAFVGDQAERLEWTFSYAPLANAVVYEIPTNGRGSGFTERVVLFFDPTDSKRRILAVGRKVVVTSDFNSDADALAHYLPNVEMKFGARDSGGSVAYWADRPTTKLLFKNGVPFDDPCSHDPYRNFYLNPQQGHSFGSTVYPKDCGRTLSFSANRTFLTQLLVDTTSLVERAASASRATNKPPEVKF